MPRVEVEDISDNGTNSDSSSSSSESEEDEFSIEAHELMKNVTSNWKIMGSMAAMFHRSILQDSNLYRNLAVKDKSPVLYKHTGEPTILSVCNVDYFSLNLVRQFYNQYDADLHYLAEKPIDQLVVNDPQEYNNLTPSTKETLKKLRTGLITVNEYAVNFISNEIENLYDSSIRKNIEYFLRQREYYLAMGQVKIKYDKEQPRPVNN